MFKLKVYYLCFFCFFSFFMNAKELSILWWNVHNFFDTTDDPDKNDIVLTEEKYREKITLLSERLKGIKADIVGLAEIENIGILKELAGRTGYSYYYLEPGNDPRGINLGLLSVYKAVYLSHRDQPTPYNDDHYFKFSRDCPEAHFIIDKKNFYLLLNHLKSSADNDKLSEKKRVAQVKGILDIIADIYQRNQKTPYILLAGDFNCERYTEPLNILQKSGLRILNYLYNENKIYTMIYQNKKKDIDFFIINSQFYTKSKVKKIKTFHGKEYENISDHYPILLEMNL